MPLLPSPTLFPDPDLYPVYVRHEFKMNVRVDADPEVQVQVDKDPYLETTVEATP